MRKNLIIVIIVLVALVGGVVLWSQKNNHQQNTKQQISKEVVKQTQGQKMTQKENLVKKGEIEKIDNNISRYINKYYNFSFEIPKDAHLVESIERELDYEYSIYLNNFNEQMLNDRVPYPIAENEYSINIDIYPFKGNSDSFNKWYIEKIQYNKDKMQKTIDFMTEEVGKDALNEKDIKIIRKEVTINGQLFKMERIKFLKPSYIEGPKSIIKKYTTIVKGYIINVQFSTPTSEKENQTTEKIFDTMMYSFKAGN